MIIKNKLDNSFGPTGKTAGILLFVVGIVSLFFSKIGLVLFLLGAFLTFTYSQSKLDVNQKRIKSVENIFGFIPIGKWLTIKPEMKLGLSLHSRGFQVNSQSNKSSGLIEKDIRIALFNAEQEKIADIKKFENRELALEELQNFALLLDIETLSISDNIS